MHEFQVLSNNELANIEGGQSASASFNLFFGGFGAFFEAIGEFFASLGEFFADFFLSISVGF